MAQRPVLLCRAAVIAVIAGASLAGFSVRAETLSEVVAYAYQVNPGVQAQRAALRALDESYVAARGCYAPNISVSIGDDRTG